MANLFVMEVHINAFESESDVKIKNKITLAELQDVLATIVEASPQATSFVVCIVPCRVYTEA